MWLNWCDPPLPLFFLSLRYLKIESAWWRGRCTKGWSLSAFLSGYQVARLTELQVGFLKGLGYWAGGRRAARRRRGDHMKLKKGKEEQEKDREEEEEEKLQQEND